MLKNKVDHPRETAFPTEPPFFRSGARGVPGRRPLGFGGLLVDAFFAAPDTAGAEDSSSLRSPTGKLDSEGRR
jgi:hypothetical protein